MAAKELFQAGKVACAGHGQVRLAGRSTQLRLPATNIQPSPTRLRRLLYLRPSLLVRIWDAGAAAWADGWVRR